MRALRHEDGRVAFFGKAAQKVISPSPANLSRRSGYFNLLKWRFCDRIERPLTPSTMTDDELYNKAKFYGRNALYWRQRFIGLLGSGSTSSCLSAKDLISFRVCL